MLYPPVQKRRESRPALILPTPSSDALRRKRNFDLFLLLFLGPPALLIVAIMALATRLLTGGPALYRQTRVGYRGRLIEVWKLRTMREDAESVLEEHLSNNPALRQEWQSNYKLKKDPRIIPYLGSFLRRTSLDELPQLFNIYKGEMSFIGPRPLPPYHHESLDTEFGAYRQLVPPGLSGLWQIRERSDGDLASHQRWDTLYLESFSLLTDIKILASTPMVVLKCRGAR